MLSSGTSPASGPPPSPAVDTSIVVATCSRVTLLQGALESLLRQTWALDHSVELVVVDDRSTDATAAFLAMLAPKAPFPLRVVAGPAVGIAAARNAGFAAARGRWIASFDDDQVADPGWLGALRRCAEQQNSVCVGGALHLLLPESASSAPLGPRVRAVLGEHTPYPMARRYRSPFQPATNNALLRRDVFLTEDGFDTRFTEGGEDKELFRRLQANGHPIWFEPAASAGHVTPAARLQPANLRWTSQRLGASDARFHRLRGPWHALGFVLLRLLAVAVRDLPRLLLGPRPASLEILCSLWYTQGLVRAHLAFQRPRQSHTDPFLASLNFRARNGERSGSPEPSAPELA